MGGRNGAVPPPPREHTLIGSPEFMAPEIVEAFIEDTEDDFNYDKRCGNTDSYWLFLRFCKV